MRAPLALGVLLLALPLTGCAQLNEAADRIRAEPPPHPDHVAFFEDFVTPSYSAENPFPVDAGALEIVVAINVTTSSPAPGPLAPPVTPVQVTFTLLTPSGAEAAPPVTVQPPARSTEIRAAGLNETGQYVLAVAGRGLAGGGQGVRYNATLVVDYPQ